MEEERTRNPKRYVLRLCAIIDKHIDEPESFPVRHEAGE